MRKPTRNKKKENSSALENKTNDPFAHCIALHFPLKHPVRGIASSLRAITGSRLKALPNKKRAGRGARGAGQTQQCCCSCCPVDIPVTSNPQPNLQPQPQQQCELGWRTQDVVLLYNPYITPGTTNQPTSQPPANRTRPCARIINNLPAACGSW